MSQLKDNEATEDEPPTKEIKQYFINEAQFQLLKQCQHEIYEQTEVSPAIRKIVNELISEENLQKIKSKYIAVWNIQ
ncbi:MAG: hypothetical protein ABI597_12545 [Gammaproteobacteria bacterium]